MPQYQIVQNVLLTCSTTVVDGLQVRITFHYTCISYCQTATHHNVTCQQYEHPRKPIITVNNFSFLSCDYSLKSEYIILHSKLQKL